MATRREKVLLEVESNLAPVFARDAAAAKLLERSIDDLDGASVRAGKSVDASGKQIEGAGKKAGTAQREIDRLSGRLRLLADTAAILGPALVPIGAVGIPAVTGLAAQMGAAALAGGTAIVAFQGVGDALKAVNKAALEPTAENLEAARIAMDKIGPEAQQFVHELRQMLPALREVRNAAAAGLFPGLVEGLDDLERVLPQVEDIMLRVGSALGDLAAGGAQSLAGPRWSEFLNFVETEVPDALTTLGRTVGKLTHGLAELWMAFDPLNDDFAGWLLDASRSFDRWAQGLSRTQGFQEFVAYIRENGPKVADALGSIGSAVLNIVEAAAPLGGPTLDALAAVADVIGAIADSDAGPAIMATVTALALLRRGMATFEAASSSSWATSIKGADTFAGKMQAARGPMIRTASAMAGLSLAASGVADGFGLANTATGAMMGAIGGPWGAAIGGAIGLMLDLTASTGGFEVSAESLQATLDEQTGAITANTTAWAANELEKQGVLADAQSLGLDLAMVTQAALGNKDAIAGVTEALKEFGPAAAAATSGRGGAAVGMNETSTAAQKVADAIGITNDALNGAQSGFARVAKATDRTAEGFRQGASAAEEFRNAVQRVNALLEKRSNVRDFEASLDDLTASLKENGRTLDINTRKGRENEAAMDNIVATAVKVAEGMRGTNRVEFLKRARADFVDATAKLLGGRDAARQMWERLADLNQTKAEPKVELVGWEAASANAHRVRNAIDEVQSKTVTITVHTVRTGGNGTGFVSGGVRRPIVPRSTTFDSSESVYGTALGRVSSANTYARTSKGDYYDIGPASQSAAAGLRGLGDMSRHELREKQRLLERELRMAQERTDAERDLLRELKDARRSLRAETAGNFLSNAFGDVDLMEAFRSGSLDMRQVYSFADAHGLTGSTIEEQVQAFIASLTSAQIAGLQVQANAGMMGNNAQNAQAFQAVLETLANDLGFDGGAFAQLAASGNLAQAQWLAQQGAGYINWFEQQYEAQQQAAQAVGQFAGNAVYADAIKEQTGVFRDARDVLHRLEQAEKRVEHAIDDLAEKVEKLPRPIGREVGKAINGTVAEAQRSV